jgi:hypothetical protein
MRSIFVRVEPTVRLVREGKVGGVALAWKLAQTLDDCMASTFVCIVGYRQFRPV